MIFGKGQNAERIVESIILEKYNSYYRLAYSYLGNEADSLDVVQEGAYKAIKNCNSLKNTDYAGTWIYRIMLNEIYNILNRISTVPIDEYEIKEAVEDNYENLDLKNAMDKLKPKEKAVIELRYFEEQRLEDIADILQENVSTVKSILYRGLKKLNVELQEK